MKIFFVSTNDWVPWGGSEVLWSKSALHLRQQGHEVHVYVKKWNPRPKHIEALIMAGCSLIEWENDYRHLPFLQRMANRVLPAKAQYKIKSKLFFAHLDEVKPNLVNISLGDHVDGAQWMTACIERGISYKIVVQLAKEAHWPADGSNVSLLRTGYMRAAQVFFVSRDNKDLLVKQFAFDFANSEVIFNPFNVPTTEPIPYNTNSEIYKLAFVASLNANHKGHDLLFEVLKQDKWKNRPIEVNLYGKGPHEEQLKLLKGFWDLQNVHFKGFNDGVKEVWAENHGLLLCSRMEGQSLALLEAMFCGRVPIVTNVGGAKDLIDHDVNGFIAKSATVECIDEVLEQAWSKREEWQEMGVLARNKLKYLAEKDPIQFFSDKLIHLS